MWELTFENGLSFANGNSDQASVGGRGTFRGCRDI